MTEHEQQERELAEVRIEYARAKESKRTAMVDHDRLLRVLRAAEAAIRRQQQRHRGSHA